MLTHIHRFSKVLWAQGLLKLSQVVDAPHFHIFNQIIEIDFSTLAIGFWAPKKSTFFLPSFPGTVAITPVASYSESQPQRVAQPPSGHNLKATPHLSPLEKARKCTADIASSPWFEFAAGLVIFLQFGES